MEYLMARLLFLVGGGLLLLVLLQKLACSCKRWKHKDQLLKMTLLLPVERRKKNEKTMADIRHSIYASDEKNAASSNRREDSKL